MAEYEAIVGIKYQTKESNVKEILDPAKGKEIVFEVGADSKGAKKEIKALKDELTGLKKLFKEAGIDSGFSQIVKQISSAITEINALSKAMGNLQQNAVLTINTDEVSKLKGIAQTITPSLNSEEVKNEISQLQSSLVKTRKQFDDLFDRDGNRVSRTKEAFAEEVRILSETETITKRLIELRKEYRSEFPKVKDEDIDTLNMENLKEGLKEVKGYFRDVKEEYKNIFKEPLNIPKTDFEQNKPLVSKSDNEAIKEQIDLVKLLSDTYDEYVNKYLSDNRKADTKQFKRDTSFLSKDEIIQGVLSDETFNANRGFQGLLDKLREIKLEADISALAVKKVGEVDSAQNATLVETDESPVIEKTTKALNEQTEALKGNTQAQQENINVPPQTQEAPTAPENKGFERTNALTEKHVALMEQAANAELEKLEISKKLANALLDEEGAFKAVGKAADDADKKAKDVDSISIGEFESEGARVSKRPMTQATADMNTHKKAILDANNAENLRSQTAQNNAKIEVQQSKLREQAKKEEISTIRASAQEEKLQNDILLQNIKLQQQTANLLKPQANDLSKQMQAFDKLDTDVEGYKEAGVAIGNLKSAFDELGKARGLKQLEESATKFNIALIEAKDSISKVQQTMKTESTSNKEFIQSLQKEALSYSDTLKNISKQEIISSDTSQKTLSVIEPIKIRLGEIKEILGDKMPVSIVKDLEAASNNAVNFDSNMQKLAIDGEKVSNEIKKVGRDWSAIKGDSKLGKEFNEITQAMEQWNFNPTKQGLDDIKSRLSLLKSDAQGAGKNIMSMGSLIEATFKRLLSYNLANTLIRSITNGFQTAIKDIKDIDNQLTQLSKVTDIVKDDFKELTIEALNSANKWGKTASDYLKAVETFAKAGKANYEALADVSILAQSAGDISAELANEYLITSDAAFQLNGNVEKLTSLLDSQNQVNKIALLYGNI